MLIDGILERNRQFVRLRQASPLTPPETKQLVVVACYDPRLDPLLLPALGLVHGEAFLLRTAGALVLPGGGVMRSLGLAVFMFGATEVLVLGHTSCRMATFRNSEFIDTFRARGVTRESFGSEDLREWAGAIASPQHGVQRSMETISGARFLPRDVTISGAVLDDTTGEIELVVRGGRPGSPEPPPESGQEAAPDVESEKPVGAGPDTDEATALADDPAPLVDAIANFVAKIEGQAKWRNESQILRQQLAQTRGPAAQFRLLESFLRRVAGESREVAQSLEGLRRHLAIAERGAVPDSLVRLLRRLSGSRP